MEGQTVSVVGWLEPRQPSYSLWDNPEAFAAGSYKQHCLGLLVPHDIKTEHHAGEWIRVIGTFKKSPPENVFLFAHCNNEVILVNSVTRVRSQEDH
jgi:hypothetical protein